MNNNDNNNHNNNNNNNHNNNNNNNNMLLEHYGERPWFKKRYRQAVDVVAVVVKPSSTHLN